MLCGKKHWGRCCWLLLPRDSLPTNTAAYTYTATWAGGEFPRFHQNFKDSRTSHFCKTNCSCKEPGHIPILMFANVPHRDLVRMGQEFTQKGVQHGSQPIYFYSYNHGYQSWTLHSLLYLIQEYAEQSISYEDDARDSERRAADASSLTSCHILSPEKLRDCLGSSLFKSLLFVCLLSTHLSFSRGTIAMLDFLHQRVPSPASMLHPVIYERHLLFLPVGRQFKFCTDWWQFKTIFLWFFSFHSLHCPALLGFIHPT